MKNADKWKLERAKEIVKLLHIGVENEDGELRNFNILDYYNIINISPKRLYEITVSELKKEYSDSEIKKFRLFVQKSLNDYKLTVKAIMDVKHSIIVNDEVREITDYDKTNVIGYLKAHNLPLTSDLYSLALKSYLSGELNINNNLDESKTLVK